MMKRIPRLLKAKAVSSLRRATAAYNGVDDDGRQTAVLLHLQHACEMLLKAALRERGIDLFERSEGRIGRSIGFEKCVRLAQEHVGLTEDELGTLRAIDSMRDDEQHWIAIVNEGLLYLHARACVTLFDEILLAIFDERLADHLPERVLPISTRPPADIDVLIDEQFHQAKQLVRPGQRRRTEARAMLRGLLALEAHVSEDAVVNERDVNRVERGVREGKRLEQIFPRLGPPRCGHRRGGTNPDSPLHQEGRGPGHLHPGRRPTRGRGGATGRSSAQVLHVTKGPSRSA